MLNINIECIILADHGVGDKLNNARGLILSE